MYDKRGEGGEFKVFCGMVRGGNEVLDYIQGGARMAAESGAQFSRATGWMGESGGSSTGNTGVTCSVLQLLWLAYLVP
jgi:hypothetical protein